MAKLVCVWAWAAPREVFDDANLTVGGTVLLTQADVDGLGEGTIDLQIQIWDDDPVSDDLVQENSDQLGGPFNLGPNSFEAEVVRARAPVFRPDG